MTTLENITELIPDFSIKAFLFLQQAREKLETEKWPAVLDLMKGSDDILALEAEQTLREMLPRLPEDVRESIEEELLEFSQSVARAIMNSDLFEVKSSKFQLDREQEFLKEPEP